MLVKRPCHILKSNKASEGPYEMIFFDTETHTHRDGGQIKHELYLIVACYLKRASAAFKIDEEVYKSFTKAEDFWKWVISKSHVKTSLYIFSHNISFDLITSKGLEILPRLGYKLKSWYEKGFTFHLVMKSGSHVIHFLNVGNYYQGTVKDIGKSFGLEKLEIDYNTATPDTAFEYCKRDVEIIKTAMLELMKFITENDLGNFGVTIAKQALNAFRHRFMKHSIFIHNNVSALELERESYHGGRTETFRMGEIKVKPVYIMDINSMYPSVMQDNLYPTRLIKVIDDPTPEEFKRMRSRFLCIARLKVKTDFPCVPVDLGKRLIFPVGEFITTLCSPEIELIEKYGEIKEVYQVALYQGEHIFSKYVEYFYQKRVKAKRSGDKVKELLYKMVLNSLYGKFAQRGYNWKVIGDCSPEEIRDEVIFHSTSNTWTKLKYIGGSILERQEEREPYNTFPAISSFVTSYARVALYKYILLAGQDNVFYCDTDSLFLSPEGYQRVKAFVSDGALGCLRLEKRALSLVIFGLKDYILNTKETHKGIPAKAQKVKENTWEVTVWPHLKTFLKRGNVSTYANEVITKTLWRNYQKGFVLSSGQVVPYILRVECNTNELIPYEETPYVEMAPLIPV